MVYITMKLCHYGKTTISAVESVEQGDRDGLLPVYTWRRLLPTCLSFKQMTLFFKLTKYTVDVDDSFADRLVVQDPNLVKLVSKPHPGCIYAETQVSHDSKVPFLSCGLEAFLQTADHEVNTSSSVVSALTLILSGGLFEVRIIGNTTQTWKETEGVQWN